MTTRVLLGVPNEPQMRTDPCPVIPLSWTTLPMTALSLLHLARARCRNGRTRLLEQLRARCMILTMKMKTLMAVMELVKTTGALSHLTRAMAKGTVTQALVRGPRAVRHQSRPIDAALVHSADTIALGTCWSVRTSSLARRDPGRSHAPEIATRWPNL